MPGCGPFEHLAVTAGIAGGQDGAPPQLALDVADLGRSLVGDPEGGSRQAGNGGSSCRHTGGAALDDFAADPELRLGRVVALMEKLHAGVPSS